MVKKCLKTLTILLLIASLVLPIFGQTIERERAQFKRLILENPNYFGTAPESGRRMVKKIWYNTRYEQLECIGYLPEASRLEAVVHVKLHYGYGGDLCKPGSHEYVRVYVDWNGDGDFLDADEDAGLASFNAHDIPNKPYPCLPRTTKPLAYSLALQLKPKKFSCRPGPYLVKVRAILSWNHEPGPGNPNYIPVWGNRIERWIQIQPSFIPRKPIVPVKVIEKLKFKPVMEMEKETEKKELKVLSPEELKALYQGKDVQELRYNYPKIHEVAMKIKKQPELRARYQRDAKLAKLLKYCKLVYTPTPNVSYEELTCVGLNYHQSKLEATMVIKRPYGYSGELCRTRGSFQYVAFWVLLKNPRTNRCYWKYFGTAKVNVHDIRNLPAGGLRYAVTLAADFSSLQDKCENPVVLKLRGILSWNTHPPHATSADADWLPVWGNRLDRFIQVKPGPSVQPNEQKPFIWSIGRMPVEGIAGNAYTMIPSSLGDGYANGPSPQGYTAVESPFGRSMIISGTITNAPNHSEGALKLRYKLQYRKDGTTFWHDLTNKFRLWIAIDGYPSGYIWQSVDSQGYYQFQKDIKAPTIIEVREDVLGYWNTPVADGDGLYELRMVVKKPTPSPLVYSEIIKVMVDNTNPNAYISLTAGACSLFEIGDVISGNFIATDKHFWFYNITLEPYAPSPASDFEHKPKPSASTYIYGQKPTYPGLDAPGATNGSFTLDTSNVVQCGYIFKVRVWDRTIRNNHLHGNYNSMPVGFCLLEKK